VAAAGDLPGRVRALGQAYLDFAQELPAAYDLIDEPGPAGPEAAAAAARYRADGRGAAAAVPPGEQPPG
jgi:hypothetical protein